MGRSILSVPCVWMAMLLAGCAVQGRTLEPTSAKTFIPFAEGITPAGDHQDPEIAGPGTLSGPASPPVQPVDALTVHPRRFEITAGEIFSLKRLIITALDSDGKPVRHVPFTIERETVDPPVVEPGKDSPEFLRGLRPGKVDLRFLSRPARADGTRPFAYFTLYVRS